MGVSPLATQIPRSHPSISSPLKTGFHAHPKTSPFKRISLARASSEPRDKPPFVSQDLKYVVKLGVGSVAGAAAIKYGSIVFPDITRPNLSLALLMIFAPVVLAVIILLNQSQIDRKT